MKNDKGFTLVEVLAMLVVLGILMGVTIPNITGILSSQKESVYKSDAKNMVESAKIKIAKKEDFVKPKAGECVVFSLNYLNDSDDLNKGPYGGTYSLYDSFVVYTRVGKTYKYYVRLVEIYQKNMGFELEDIDNIKAENDNITEIDSLLGLSEDKTSSLTILNSNTLVKSKCPNGIISYYAK